MAWDMVLENCTSLTVATIQDNSKMTRQKVKVDYIIQMETTTKEISKIMWHTDTESIFQSLEGSIKDTGKKISAMEKESKPGLMEPSSRANMNIIKNQVTESSSTSMVIPILDRWRAENETEKELWNSKMEDSTKVTGSRTKCMEMEHFFGLLEIATKASIWKIRSMARVNLSIKTALIMREHGGMECVMVQVLW